MKRLILTAAQWSEQTRNGEKPDAQTTVLSLGSIDQVEKATKDQGGGMVFTISTSTPDRYKDVVVQAGIDLQHYYQNPIVLYQHDYYAPIATAPRTYLAEGKLKSIPDFPSQDVNPFGCQIGKMAAARMLRAASIGFRALKSTWNNERGGYDFAETELLEWSIVGVPANPECLLEARGLGIDLEPLREFYTRAVSIYLPEMALLPKATVERALAIVSGNPVTVAVEREAEPTPEPQAPALDPGEPAESDPKIPASGTAAVEAALSAELDARLVEMTRRIDELFMRGGAPAPAPSAPDPAPKEPPEPRTASLGLSREDILATAQSVIATLGTN